MHCIAALSSECGSDHKMHHAGAGGYATCDLPVFRAGAITWQAFRVWAVTCHIGDLPSCGHYRSILYLSDGLQLATDDRVKAKKLSAKDRSLSQAGNYIICLSSNF